MTRHPVRTLGDVYDHPVGRDVLDKIALQIGVSALVHRGPATFPAQSDDPGDPVSSPCLRESRRVSPQHHRGGRGGAEYPRGTRRWRGYAGQTRYPLKLPDW